MTTNLKKAAKKAIAAHIDIKSKTKGKKELRRWEYVVWPYADSPYISQFAIWADSPYNEPERARRSPAGLGLSMRAG